MSESGRSEANRSEALPTLEVVVPVLGRADLTRQLFECLVPQAGEMQRITLIDNGGDAETLCVVGEFVTLLPIVHLPQGKPLGVNASWNLGLARARADLVAVLNNDIVLPPVFLRSVRRAFQQEPSLGIVVPASAPTPQAARNQADCGVDLEPIPGREGWAFTIRREVAAQIGPIPPGIVTFFGDDYLFAGVREQGLGIARISDLALYHHVNATIRALGIATDCRNDSVAWLRIVAERMKASPRPRVWAEAVAGCFGRPLSRGARAVAVEEGDASDVACNSSPLGGRS